MELIKSVTQRNKLSDIGYTILNAIYAGMLLALILGFEGPYLAYLAVLLSKWRVFVVRPRFWLANIQTNMLDTLMGLAVVTILWQNIGNLTIQLLVTCGFALWLIFLKPRSKRLWVIIQGAVTQFVALSALFSVAYAMPLGIVVLLGGAIGYYTARHIIHAFGEEREDVVLSLAWALVVAELSWLAYYWTIAYTELKITQIALLSTLLGYMALVVYAYLYHREQEHDIHRDLTMPIMFSLAGIALLLVFFNGFDPTSL